MGARVLIIDDVVCSRHIVKRGLEQGGHTVFEGTTAADSAAVLKKESLDLIIIDLLMPAKEGFEMFNQVARASGIPIFAMTAGIDENYIKKAVLYGVKEVLRKPLNFEHLNSLIKKHCSLDGARASKVMICLPQAVLDAATAEAAKTKKPLEDFLGEALAQMFKVEPEKVEATAESVAEPQPVSA